MSCNATAYINYSYFLDNVAVRLTKLTIKIIYAQYCLSLRMRNLACKRIYLCKLRQDVRV